MACTDNQGMQNGKLHVVYGDVTLGVHGERNGKRFSYLFPMQQVAPSRSVLMEENGCIVRHVLPFGEPQRTMTEEMDSR